MRKYLIIVLAAFFLVSCGKKEAIEANIAQDKVELMGDLYGSFGVTGDAHLLMVPNPENKSAWMIRATVPIQKIDQKRLKTLSAGISLLDANGTKIDENFILVAEDLNSILPIFNSSPDTEKTLVFSAPEGLKKDFSYKEASSFIEKVKKFGLTLTASKLNIPTGANKKETTAAKDESSSTPDDSMTLEDLLDQYDMYDKLEQYESCLKKGQKKKAKQIEDEMWVIEKKVKADPSIPWNLRTRFMNYIENKEDQIEAKY